MDVIIDRCAALVPGNHESAGKRRSGKAGKGNAALRTAWEDRPAAEIALDLSTTRQAATRSSGLSL